MCFLADVLQLTNILQCVLQGSKLNFLQVKYEVEKLIGKLKTKYDVLSQPGSYFEKLNDFIEISQRSSGT